MPLTVKEVKNAKPGRHSDGKGLYLLVKPSGAKSWVLRVQYEGERRDFGLGSVTLDPVGSDIPLHRKKLLTLAEAREKAREGRALAKAGIINPNEYWRKLNAAEKPARSFREVAEEVHNQTKAGWKDAKHREEWLGSLKRYAFPIIGDISVEDVDASAIESVLLPIWLVTPETARRVKQRIGVVLDHAFSKDERSREAPMRAVNLLMRKIKQPRSGNFAAMPHKSLPGFVARLREEDESVGRLALLFSILTVARPGETRNATWSEIDMEAAEWRIPAEKMKAGKPHIVPLVPAALNILRKAQSWFGAKPNAFVFQGNKGRPLSDATMNKALRSTEGGVGWTVHGLRSTFRDWAAESGFNNDWAEAALAHTIAAQEGRTVASYKRTTFFEHRRDKLMPAWASFALGDKSNIVSLVERRAQ